MSRHNDGTRKSVQHLPITRGTCKGRRPATTWPTATPWVVKTRQLQYRGLEARYMTGTGRRATHAIAHTSAGTDGLGEALPARRPPHANEHATARQRARQRHANENRPVRIIRPAIASVSRKRITFVAWRTLAVPPQRTESVPATARPGASFNPKKKGGQDRQETKGTQEERATPQAPSPQVVNPNPPPRACSHFFTTKKRVPVLPA